MSTSQTLTDSDIVQVPGGPAGQTMTTDAVPLSDTVPDAPSTGRPLVARDLADQTSGLGFDISQAAFTCKGSGDPTIALTADLSDTHFDLSLITTDPAAPSISFLITADPVFNINVDFTGTVTCELSNAHFIEADIPIPGTPDLWVDLYPVLTFDASGQVSIDFQWKPRAAVGFEKGPGIDSEVHGFGSSGSVAIKAAADADLYLGIHADISLAGRAGVGGDFGPDLPASYDSGTGCVTVDGQAKADLTANASVFVKTWTFTLASGTFDKQQLFHECGPQTSPSPTSTSSPTPSPPDPSSSPAPTAGSPGWTAAEAPLPADAQSDTGEELSGVSCPSASQCVAVGNYDVADQGGFGLLLTDSGGSWTAAQAPLPANADSGAANATLSAVSCPAVSQCVAVGTYDDTAGVAQGLVVTSSDGSWTAQEAPVPANAAVRSGMYLAQLFAVSCPSASQCVAVGEYSDSQGQWQPYLLTLSNGSWTAAEAPIPDNGVGGGWVTGVSCPSAAQCVAVGDYGAGGAGYLGMVLTSSDGSWTAATAPLPANNAEAGDTVSVVSCPAVSQCVAVGNYGPSTNGQMGLLLTDSDGSWTAAEAPLAANGANGGELGLPGVSCGAVSQCVAVGAYYDTTGGEWQQGLLLTGSGSSWSAAQAPLPANAQIMDNTVTTGSAVAVSCPSAAQCVAVGNYTATSGSGGLLETLSDGT